MVADGKLVGPGAGAVCAGEVLLFQMKADEVDDVA